MKKEFKVFLAKNGGVCLVDAFRRLYAREGEGDLRCEDCKGASWSWLDRQASLVLEVAENGCGRFAKLDIDPILGNGRSLVSVFWRLWVG